MYAVAEKVRIDAEKVRIYTEKVRIDAEKVRVYTEKVRICVSKLLIINYLQRVKNK
ncbi:MAG: hypothetical protein ACYC2U_00030 [Candidatus Amoebophilus sp.]